VQVLFAGWMPVGWDFSVVILIVSWGVLESAAR